MPWLQTPTLLWGRGSALALTALDPFPEAYLLPWSLPERRDRVHSDLFNSSTLGLEQGRAPEDTPVTKQDSASLQGSQICLGHCLVSLQGARQPSMGSECYAVLLQAFVLSRKCPPRTKNLWSTHLLFTGTELPGFL